VNKEINRIFHNNITDSLDLSYNCSVDGLADKLLLDLGVDTKKSTGVDLDVASRVGVDFSELNWP